MPAINKPLIWQFTASEMEVSSVCPCGSGRKSKCFVEWKRKHTRAATPRAIVVGEVCNKVEANFCARAYRTLRKALRMQLGRKGVRGTFITEEGILNELEEWIEDGSWMALKVRNE